MMMVSSWLLSPHVRVLLYCIVAGSHMDSALLQVTDVCNMHLYLLPVFA